MSEMVGMSWVQGRGVVHGVVVGRESVGVIVMKSGSVMLLIADQIARKEPVDGEGVVGSVARGCCRAEMHLIQFHR